MAYSILGTESKTANGTLTIPANCTLIYALEIGSVVPPAIDGSAMEKLIGVDSNGYVAAISIHQYKPPATGSAAFTFSGTNVLFVYLSGAEGFRPGGVSGVAKASVSGELPTSTADLVIALLVGQIGPTALKGDGSAFTYWWNETLYKAGYKAPGDSSLTCLAEDTGVSAGYYIDGGTHTEGGDLIEAGHYVWDPVWNPGYYQWELQYVNGIEQWVNVWHPPYYTYVARWVEATYTPIVEVDNPDIWVPGGDTAYVAGCFISISTGAVSDDDTDVVFM